MNRSAVFCTICLTSAHATRDCSDAVCNYCGNPGHQQFAVEQADEGESSAEDRLVIDENVSDAGDGQGETEADGEQAEAVYTL